MNGGDSSPEEPEIDPRMVPDKIPVMNTFHSYDPSVGHGLPHDPLKSIVAPRPIGWISTRTASGSANLAPYSFFNLASSRPPLVMFSSEGRKDTLSNIEENGEFCCNLVSFDLATKMAVTGCEFAKDIDEFSVACIESTPCDLIKVRRVSESPAALECRTIETRQLTDLNLRKIDVYLVIGQVVKVHIRREFLKNGRFEMASARPVARAGYRADYIVADQIFGITADEAGGE